MRLLHCVGDMVEAGCPFFTLLGDGHFGHVRFKNFVNFDFDGHLVWGQCVGS